MGELIDDGGSLMLNLVSVDYKKKKRENQESTLVFEHEKVSNKNVSPISKKLLGNEKSSKPAFGKKQDFGKVSSTSKESEDQKTIRKQKPNQMVSSSLFTGNPVVGPLNIEKSESISEPLFSTKTFDEIELHPHLVSCLKSRLDIVRMTKVQEQTIPLLLKGQDVLVKSCTGTGKTLAYAIPIVQKLQGIEPKIKRADGVYALIIVPSREMALQTFEIFSTLTKAFTWIVPGFLIGGEKKKSEKARLRKGINILISTPGRLLDHLEHTKCLSLQNIAWLVIDEADKLLEQDFEENLKRIISFCYENRQSTLLSATLSKSVQNLAGDSLKNPVYVDISNSPGQEFADNHDLTIPTNLKQYVVIVPPKLRLVILSSFIIDNYLKGNLKGLIFMSSQSSVDFHHALFTEVLATYLSNKGSKCKFFKLHGHMKQEERTEIFHRYKSAKEGVLFCSDVAARGLDLPHVDWIIQYSAPYSAEIYVHRVGRTARIGKKGNSLLFLLPSEISFSAVLVEHKINLEEISVNHYLQLLLQIQDQLNLRKKCTAEDCATALQTAYETAVYKEEDLHKSAKDGFSGYIHSYMTYPKVIRQVLPFKLLHLGHIAKSFCLQEAPSNLGGPSPNPKPQSVHRNSEKKPSMKRKMQAMVSEFSSGLSSVKLEVAKKTEKNETLMCNFMFILLYILYI